MFLSFDTRLNKLHFEVLLNMLKQLFIMYEQSFVPYTPDSLLGTPCYYYVTPLHRFNKRAGNILPEIFGPYRHDRITQLLQICQLHVHDENLIFHHIPKLVYWIEIWRLRRQLEHSELYVTVHVTPQYPGGSKL